MPKISLTKEQSCFYWKLVNLDLCPQLHGEAIRSPQFSLDSSGITKVSLNLYPKGTGRKNKCVCVKLIRHKSVYGTLYKNKYKLRLNLSGNGKEIYDKVLCIDFAEADKEILWTLPDLFDAIERNIASRKGGNYSFLGSLAMCLIVTPISSTPGSFWTCKTVDLENLSSDLAEGFDVSCHSDLLFKTNDDMSFKVHKAIVSSRYPSLAETLELHKNQIHEFYFCTDSKTLQVLLKYLYSGKMETTNVPTGVHDILNSMNLHHLHNLLFPIPMYTRANSTVRAKKCSFTWSLDNFSAIPDNAKLYYTFCCADNLPWTQLRVGFYFTDSANQHYARKEHSKCTKQWIALSVQRLCSGANIRMKCKIGIVNDILGQREFDHTFVNESEWEAPCFISKQFLIDRKDSLLPEDILRINFEFKISDGILISDIDTACHPDGILTRSKAIATNLWILQQDLLKIYRNGRFSDVTLCVGEERFPAHKAILSLRSAVFNKLFQTESLKEKSDFLIIENFEPEVIQTMLSYIYSGEVDKKGQDFEFVTKLYAASNEYQVKLLKQKCVDYLHHVLNFKNAAEILLLADNYQDFNLKEHVLNFVRPNKDDILNSREWKRIIIGERLDLEDYVFHDSPS